MAIKLFSIIGIVTTIILGVILINNMISKIKYWRKHKTKIKCLCKPHIYIIDWIYGGSEMCLKCTKCGKTKKLYIDKESLESWFGRGVLEIEHNRKTD